MTSTPLEPGSLVKIDELGEFFAVSMNSFESINKCDLSYNTHDLVRENKIARIESGGLDDFDNHASALTLYKCTEHLIKRGKVMQKHFIVVPDEALTKNLFTRMERLSVPSSFFGLKTVRNQVNRFVSTSEKMAEFVNAHNNAVIEIY